MLEDTTGSFTASSNVVRDPTNLTGGSTIDFEYSWSDRKTGTVRRDEEEWIRDQNQTYAVVIETDEATNAAFLKLEWYEHTNKTDVTYAE